MADSKERYLFDPFSETGGGGEAARADATIVTVNNKKGKEAGMPLPRKE